MYRYIFKRTNKRNGYKIQLNIRMITYLKKKGTAHPRMDKTRKLGDKKEYLKKKGRSKSQANF